MKMVLRVPPTVSLRVAYQQEWLFRRLQWYWERDAKSSMSILAWKFHPRGIVVWRGDEFCDELESVSIFCL
jgi:hypothetical protein